MPNTKSVKLIVDNIQTTNVNSLQYLGSIISRDGPLNKEIVSKISKAIQALRQMCTRVLSQHNFYISTKLKVYTAVVIPQLLYRYKSWTLY